MSVLGFSVKSPFDGITHYTYGDGDWRVRVMPLGGGDARYTNRHASAFFGFSAKRGESRAEDFTEHPGDIAIFARLHLVLKERLQGERFTLDSKQVHELIGGTS